MRLGGRQKGTPNKVTTEKALKIIVDEFTQKIEERHHAGQSVLSFQYNNGVINLNTFAACVQALELIKANKMRKANKDVQPL